MTERTPHSGFVANDHADVLRLARELMEAYEHASEHGAAVDVLQWRFASRVIELEEQLEATQRALKEAAGGATMIRVIAKNEGFTNIEGFADKVLVAIAGAFDNPELVSDSFPAKVRPGEEMGAGGYCGKHGLFTGHVCPECAPASNPVGRIIGDTMYWTDGEGVEHSGPAPVQSPASRRDS